MPTEIKLTTDIADLRDIYFGANHQKYFFGPSSKRQSTYLTIGLILYPGLAFYSVYSHDGWIFIINTLVLGYLIYDFIKIVYQIHKWKKSVEQFLVKAESIKDLRFIYDEEYFMHVQDGETIKRNWNTVENATINERSISIDSEPSIFLPRSSMSQTEYSALTEMIIQVVKNVHKY